MKRLQFLFLALFIISCSNEDSPEKNSESESLITEINANIYNSALSSELKFTFDYDSNQRLILKNGGFISISLSTGFNNIFTNKVHTSFTYNGNQINIENFSTYSDLSIQKETRIVTLNSSNKIETKEIPNLSNSFLSKKLNYTYTGNKLIKIVTTYPNMPYDATDPDDYILSYTEFFYYDSKGNLTKTEYFEQQNGINKGQKIIQTFEDYDSSENPCQKLQLLDEFFYRSLSSNNFRKYTQSKYSDDVLVFENTSTWNFTYDQNGKIIIK